MSGIDNFENDSHIFFYGEDTNEVLNKDDPFEILAAIEEEADTPLVYLVFTL